MDIMKLYDKYGDEPYLEAEEAFNIYGQCKQHVVFTLKPELYKKRARTQYMLTMEHLEDILDIYCDSYIVVAELTESSNVHYHCLLEFNKAMPESKYKMIDLLKLSHKFGSVWMNKKIIPNKTEWVRTYVYITKEVVKTSKVINTNPKYDELPMIKQCIVQHTTTLQDHNNDALDKIIDNHSNIG